MKCLLCGEECTNNSQDKKRIVKYCSREHYLEYMEKQRNTPKSYCLNCNKPIYTLTNRGNIRKYCSDECRKEKRHKDRFKYVVCQFCGKTFEEKRDSPNLYCSRKCSGLGTMRLAALKKAESEELKEQADTEHKKALFEQYEELMKQAEEIRKRIESEKVCIVCGSVFVSKSPQQICCSEQCSKRRENQRKDKRIYKNGAPDLSITLTKLYMRDQGVCQICGRRIDFDCDSNSDYYPSIDHIIPISKGGEHQWGNVQLACRVCNTLKGAKLDQTPPTTP